MFQSGFLGTDASFITDLTLLAEIIFFIAICIGVVAQRRGRYRLHDWIQTPVVILNLTTFTEPGVYQIYCTLHGSPNSSGVTATITVTE